MATHEDSAIFNLNKISRNWSRIGIWCHGSLWVFFWLPNLTKVMESFSKFYGIAFSQEEREVPWIIIKRLLARSRTLCGYLAMWPPISLRPNSLCSRGLTKTDYHLIASTKTDFQFFFDTIISHAFGARHKELNELKNESFEKDGWVGRQLILMSAVASNKGGEVDGGPVSSQVVW